jgi:hypothetical protein
MSNGFIYVVDAHFIDKIEENKYPGPKSPASACGSDSWSIQVFEKLV